MQKVEVMNDGLGIEVNIKMNVVILDSYNLQVFHVVMNVIVDVHLEGILKEKVMLAEKMVST